MRKKYNAIENSKANASKTFIKGAAIMTFSMFVVKLLGFFDKILISNLYSILGDEYAAFGTAIYGNAYELYIPLFTIATAGFPIAISRLITESLAQKRYNDVRQIHRVSKPFFAITGTICFIIMFFGSFFYVNNVIDSPYSLYPTMMLSPAILLGCLVSIYRGYFEGQRNMFPTAISEIIEAGTKLVLGLVIAYAVMMAGVNSYESTNTVFGLTFSGANAYSDAIHTILAFSVTGAILGIVLGSLGAFLFLYLRYKIGGSGISKEYYENSIDARTQRETFIKIFKTALPIGLTALVMNIGSWVDAVVIQNVLDSMEVTHGKEIIAQYMQYDIDLTNIVNNGTLNNSLWGCYCAALPLMQLITAVTQAFGTAAMPSVASAWTKGNKKELKESIETVLKMTTIFALPAGLGLTALAPAIMDIVYTSDTVATIGALALQVMGFTGISISIVTPLCSMLQGIGRVDLPLKLYAMGILVKISTTWMFVSNPAINIQGASVGSLMAYTLMAITAMYMLVKHSGVMPNFISTIIKPLISALLSVSLGYFAQMWLENVVGVLLSTVFSIVIVCIVYIIFLFILRTFAVNELKFLPKGEKIANILEKYHIIR